MGVLSLWLLQSQKMWTADLMNGEFVNNLGIQMCLETERKSGEGQSIGGKEDYGMAPSHVTGGSCAERKVPVFPPDTQLGCSLRSATFDCEAAKIISPF